MNKISEHVVAALTALGLGTVPLAVAHEGGPRAGLGSVQFKVDCNDAAQKDISLAMAYYHSFAWQQVAAPLNRVLQADPGCGMAYWVRAMSLLDNPFTWPIPLNEKVLKEVPEALEMARKAGLKTQRERDYVEALAVLFKDHDKLNHRTRAKAFEEALGQVAQRYPDDKEATIIHEMSQLRTFLNWCFQRGHIDKKIEFERPKHDGQRRPHFDGKDWTKLTRFLRLFCRSRHRRVCQ